MITEEKYLDAFFNQQSDYYIKKYNEHHAGKRFTFNIGTFLCGYFWFLYRKLFVQLLLVIIVLFLLGLPEEFIYSTFQISAQTQWIVFLCSTVFFSILLGFLGNYLYIKKADKIITSVLSKTENEEERLSLLRKKGGTTWIPMIIIGVLLVLYILYVNQDTGVPYER